MQRGLINRDRQISGPKRFDSFAVYHFCGPLVQREDDSLAPIRSGFDSPEVHQSFGLLAGIGRRGGFKTRSLTGYRFESCAAHQVCICGWNRYTLRT